VIAGNDLLVMSFPVDGHGVMATLTRAENAVALAVHRGLSNEEIARVRGTSLRTVANQVAAVFRKLGVASRVELSHRLALGVAPGEEPTA